MTRDKDETLPKLIAAADAIRKEILADFNGLSEPQLNWKPDANRWSIAQCFDHLLTANGAYFPIFENLLKGEKPNTFWERLPWLPAFWGKLLIQAVAPESARKLKAPAVFHPSSSRIDGAVIQRFIDQQNQVIGYMKATEGFNVEKVILSSPVTKFITYSLLDAYKIIINHEKRHLEQAGRVLEMTGFPHGFGISPAIIDSEIE